MPKTTEELLAEVNNEVKRIGDDVKQTAEKALAESKNAGTLSAETKEKADQLLTEQTAIKAKQEALEARQLEIEQGLKSRKDDKKPVRSAGQQVVESEELKAYIANGARGATRIQVQNAITSIDASAGSLITRDRDTELVRLPMRRMTVRQLLRQSRTAGNLVEFARQVTRTNAAAMVAEGAQKPESAYAWELADAPVRTIAHWVPVSRQAMEDAGQLQGEIDGELRYGLDIVEENELLKGDGTGQHLEGLVTAATAYAAAFAVVGETPIDTLRLALLQASLAEYPADGIVLNPTDWARIELTKDDSSRYVFANPVQLAGPTLWGQPVVATQAMDVAEFLVGAFLAAATIWDRMDAEVVISSEDRDNFIKNMLTVRAEKRLALGIKRPAALITGEFVLPSA